MCLIYVITGGSMGHKSITYIQLTVKLPPKLYNILKQYAENRSLTMQDSIVIALLDYFGMVQPGGAQG